MLCLCYAKRLIRLWMQIWLPHDHRDLLHHASIETCLPAWLFSCWCASRWHPVAITKGFQWIWIGSHLSAPAVASLYAVRGPDWTDCTCKDLLHVLWSLLHNMKRAAVRSIWSPNHTRRCIFDVLFPPWPHFFPTAASAYLHQSPSEAFGFYSMLCCLSLPLLSASQCPLWLLLLYMMNVTCFALFCELDGDTGDRTWITKTY